MEKKESISEIINSLKRYFISTDWRYGHNRDSKFVEELGFWVYEVDTEKGKWVKAEELFQLIELPNIDRYTICNNCGFEEINSIGFEYDESSENWIKKDIDGIWIKWSDINNL